MTEDLEREIEQTREHLGETVDALAAKLDVKGRAADKVAQVDKAKVGTAVGVLVAGVVAAVLIWPRR